MNFMAGALGAKQLELLCGMVPQAVAMTATTARAIGSPVGWQSIAPAGVETSKGAAPKGALAGCSSHR